ncbi:hypothetical protein HPB48_010058 [Haemaphysalis longicornis]|uniref:Uncharacterized protein n=1 Tax=Haemaphysalis longicornis TaxID=44386 RepID=A0A9J6FC04_HAELO|nr:hypothetical protein HPB48_010058 [Haemaphysalis longicornis]
MYLLYYRKKGRSTSREYNFDETTPELDAVSEHGRRRLRGHGRAQRDRNAGILRHPYCVRACLGQRESLCRDGKREDVMKLDAYDTKIRWTKPEQHEFVREVIPRVTKPDSEPLTVVFTGSAGWGKTFLLQLVMTDTANMETD